MRDSTLKIKWTIFLGSFLIKPPSSYDGERMTHFSCQCCQRAFSPVSSTEIDTRQWVVLNDLMAKKK